MLRLKTILLCSGALCFASEPSRFTIEVGHLNTYFELKDVSGNPASSQGYQVSQFAISARTERLLPVEFGTSNFFNVRGTLAPIHNGGEHFIYGFGSLGGMITHHSDSQRWSASLGLDLRYETYVFRGLYDWPAGQNLPTYRPEVKDSLVRPWITCSFGYAGILVPFRTRTRVEPITRFEISQAFLTSSGSDIQGKIRQGSEHSQGSLGIGARF